MSENPKQRQENTLHQELYIGTSTEYTTILYVGQLHASQDILLIETCLSAKTHLAI